MCGRKDVLLLELICLMVLVRMMLVDGHIYWLQMGILFLLPLVLLVYMMLIMSSLVKQ